MHPELEQIQAFVMGKLDRDVSAEFIEHVSSCDECAEKLQAEARLELAIDEIEQAVRRRERPRPWLRSRRGRLAQLLAAALVTVGLVVGAFALKPHVSKQAQVPQAPAPIPPVVCKAGRHQKECVEDAHLRGLYVAWPEWGGPPALGGRRGPDAGPRFPFTLAKR